MLTFGVLIIISNNDYYGSQEWWNERVVGFMSDTVVMCE